MWIWILLTAIGFVILCAGYNLGYGQGKQDRRHRELARELFGPPFVWITIVSGDYQMFSSEEGARDHLALFTPTTPSALYKANNVPLPE